MTLSTSAKYSPPPPSAEGPQPTWDIVKLFPAQGMWSEDDYFDLKGNYLIELSEGSIEVLEMPTEAHQDIVLFIYSLLAAFVSPRNLGKPLVAPFRIRLWERTIREPDIMFMKAENAARRSNEIWDGADLVMEVVSDDGRKRDLEEKRVEYARAGISEYWIVDPQYRRITVLKLDGQQYAVHGEFADGQNATSALLRGFEVPVRETFDAAGADRR